MQRKKQLPTTVAELTNMLMDRSEKATFVIKMQVGFLRSSLLIAIAVIINPFPKNREFLNFLRLVNNYLIDFKTQKNLSIQLEIQ